MFNYGFNDIAHILKPGGSEKFTCDLTMYGEMEAGHYRIVKENLYAEFDIGSDTVGATAHRHRIDYELGDFAEKGKVVLIFFPNELFFPEWWKCGHQNGVVEKKKLLISSGE